MDYCNENDLIGWWQWCWRLFPDWDFVWKFRERLVVRSTCVLWKFEFFFFFFLLKLSAVYTFWIVLMCWCQKWFLKNKKTSLACISARKVIWKTPATTLPNTLLVEMVFLKKIKNKTNLKLMFFNVFYIKIIFKK